MARILLHSFIQSSFTALKILRAPPIHYNPGHTFWQPLIILRSILLFPECHIVGLTKYTTFSVWLLSNIHLCFLHVFPWLDHSFLFSSEYIPCLYMPSFISTSTEGYLGSFQVLGIMNKAAINILVQVLCGH